MLLLFTFSLLAAGVVQGGIEEVEVGVCHEIRHIPYTENEWRQVSETRKEWCWVIGNFFKCEVSYPRWITVLVAKMREVNVRVCCEGFHEGDNGKCEPDDEEREVEDVPEEEHNANVEEDGGPAPNEQVVVQVPSEDENKADVEEEPEVIIPVVPSENRTEVEQGVTASPNTTAVDPVPSEVADHLSQVLSDVHKEHQVETMAAEMIAIIGKELLKSLDNSTTAPATVAATAAAIVPIGANPEVMAAEMVSIVAKELLKSLDNSTIDPVVEPAAPAAVAATAAPTVPIGANPEVMAAEMVSIVAKELLKPLDDTPIIKVVPLPSIPEEVSTSVETNPPDTEPLNYSTIEQVIVETMLDLNEAHLLALSRLHSIWSLLRQQAPRRASFE